MFFSVSTACRLSANWVWNIFAAKIGELMIIETEHLIIRDFQEKDAVGLLEYLSHPRVNCFVSERLCSEESALAYISNTPKELLRYACA